MLGKQRNDSDCISINFNKYILFSGSGKSTLLNVLNFRNLKKFKSTAAIKINGRQISSNELNSVSAYIQQDDLFIGTLTVKEHLTFLVIFVKMLIKIFFFKLKIYSMIKAMLKMGPFYSDKEKRERVEEILKEVQIKFLKVTRNFLIFISS